MDINHNDNIINRLSNLALTDEALNGVDLSFHLVRVQKESDSFYQSSGIQLAPDVIKWVKKSIIKTLQGLKEVDDTESKVFLVGNYNHEIKINDRIARFELSENLGLLDKVRKLTTALRTPDPEYPEKHTSFQMVKLTLGEQDAYFCYYRGVKKNSMRTSSKKIWAIKNANQFIFTEDTMIDLGGNIDFFIVGDFIFIINVRHFEFAFDYRDHINEQRDRNLTEIISMPFFDGENSNKGKFEESCKKYIHSRGLAQIKRDTLTAIQTNFEARCNELSQIKANLPEDQAEQERYKKKYSMIWELFEYIDLDNRKIIFKEGASPRALLHFFADKIVKSFVSEDFKVAIAYEE
ncbi:Kiwa anti-phage protein KwaB-like domain-containing protein [Cohnella massiliensis]|uniref:Kiwa anti-phage protein KwaB-like domain-containing protein n=1 Tax=Cohnella massiliensis TaxID=1816691 RepID=UPI000AF7D70C|nr:Kiwa anti-phage protein KwaB-like domain-containing protein [Cohnella massiliensis]